MSRQEGMGRGDEEGKGVCGGRYQPQEGGTQCGKKMEEWKEKIKRGSAVNRQHYCQAEALHLSPTLPLGY